MDEVIFEAGASRPRVIIGAGAVVSVGLFLLIAVIMAPDAGVVEIALFLAIAGVALWQGKRMWDSSQRRLQLREDGLWLDTGECVAPMDQIVRIDRSLFTFKPSNGFLLILGERAPRGGQSGLYWRRGKRVGVGGLIPGWQSRGMADMIEAMLMQRDGLV